MSTNMTVEVKLHLPKYKLAIDLNVGTGMNTPTRCTFM